MVSISIVQWVWLTVYQPQVLSTGTNTAGTLKVYFHGEWLNLKSGEYS